MYLYLHFDQFGVYVAREVDQETAQRLYDKSGYDTPLPRVETLDKGSVLCLNTPKNQYELPQMLVIS